MGLQFDLLIGAISEVIVYCWKKESYHGSD